jgi:predicted nucleic acid-binding protein
MLSAAPALIEGYAVLTRLPPPHRMGPDDALALLDTNFIRARRVIALDAKSYCDLLRRAPGEEVSGGRTYDAVIAACALRARATTLLTFNAEHFAAYSDRGLEIVVP